MPISAQFAQDLHLDDLQCRALCRREQPVPWLSLVLLVIITDLCRWQTEEQEHQELDGSHALTGSKLRYPYFLTLRVKYIICFGYSFSFLHNILT